MDDPYKREWELLRDGMGINLPKLAECKNLLKLLGTGDVEVALERMNEVLNKMGDSNHAEALRMALNIDEAHDMKLTRRRQWLAELKGKSLEAVKLWEPEGQRQFEILAKQLFDELEIVESIGVTCTVSDGRITKKHLFINGKYYMTDDHGDYSIPSLIYRVPTEMPMRKFVVGLEFDVQPNEVWVLTGTTLGAVISCDYPFILKPLEGRKILTYSYTWHNPAPDCFISISWR